MNAINIENLKKYNERNMMKFTANTYPINFDGMTGLYCRVIAEIE